VDFGGRQGGPSRASPQRAVSDGPTQPAAKRHAALRVAAQKARRLRGSSVTDLGRYAPSSRLAFGPFALQQRAFLFRDKLLAGSMRLNRRKQRKQRGEWRDFDKRAQNTLQLVGNLMGQISIILNPAVGFYERSGSHRWTQINPDFPQKRLSPGG